MTTGNVEARLVRDDGWLYLDRARADLADAVIRFHAAGQRIAGDRCDRILNAVEALLTESDHAAAATPPPSRATGG
jgi:hypothetical protein